MDTTAVGRLCWPKGLGQEAKGKSVIEQPGKLFNTQRVEKHQLKESGVVSQAAPAERMLAAHKLPWDV